MSTLGAATLLRVDARGFALSVACGGGGAAPAIVHCFVAALDDHVMRVCFAGGSAPPSATPPARTAAVLQAASGGAVAVEHSSTTVTLRTGALTVTATLAPSLSLRWARADDGRVFAQDRLSRAYALGVRAPDGRGGVFHACRRGGDDMFFGLGDKTGPLTLAGRRLRTHMADALGRDPECVRSHPKSSRPGDVAHPSWTEWNMC